MVIFRTKGALENFHRSYSGIVAEIFGIVLDDVKRFKAIQKEVYIITKEELLVEVLPHPAKAYYIESIEKLNELGRAYSAETDKEIALCKKLVEYNKFEFGFGENFVKDTNRIELIIKSPVREFIDKNYEDILEIRKEYISEESYEEILNNFQLSQDKKTALQSFLKFLEDGATKYPRLLHILLEWPLFSRMPKLPRELLNLCEKQEYEWMMKGRNSTWIKDSVFSKPETQSTTWFIYPKGESWCKDSGIKRFTDISIDIDMFLDYDWIKLLHSYSLSCYPITTGIRVFDDGWDGLFDDDYNLNDQGFRKGLYNCYCITDVFYESIRLCTKLLSIGIEINTDGRDLLISKKRKSKFEKQFIIDIERLNQVKTPKDFISTLRDIIPYWIKFKGYIDAWSHAVDIHDQVRIRAIQFRAEFDWLPNVPKKLLDIQDWLTDVERIIRKPTEPEQKIKLFKEPKKNNWKPPKGYIGSKEIVNVYEVPRSTLEGWQNQDDVSGGELEGKLKKDDQTQERYFPEKWFKKRLKNYRPRDRET